MSQQGGVERYHGQFADALPFASHCAIQYKEQVKALFPSHLSGSDSY